MDADPDGMIELAGLFMANPSPTFTLTPVPTTLDALSVFLLALLDAELFKGNKAFARWNSFLGLVVRVVAYFILLVPLPPLPSMPVMALLACMLMLVLLFLSKSSSV